MTFKEKIGYISLLLLFLSSIAFCFFGFKLLWHLAGPNDLLVPPPDRSNELIEKCVQERIITIQGKSRCLTLTRKEWSEVVVEIERVEAEAFNNYPDLHLANTIIKSYE